MFINFQNQQKLEKARYSRSVLINVLEALVTKDGSKIESMIESVEDTFTLDEVLHLFSDKMTAMRLFSTFEAEAKPGPDPYMRDLDDEEKEDKEDQMKDQAAMDDDDPDAYKEMPGDKEAREKGEVKTSKHTKAYADIYSDEEEANEGLGMGMIEPFLPVIIGYIESGGAGRLVHKIKKNFKAIPKVINNFKNMDDIARILNKLEKHPKIDGYLNNLDPEGVEVMFQELSMADMKIMYGHLGLDWNPKEYLEIKRKADKGEWANEAVDTDTIIQIELEDGIYYIKPYGDSTHFHMSTKKDGIENAIPAHIGQHKSRPYYADLRKFLKGGPSIDGNVYEGVFNDKDTEDYQKGLEIAKKYGIPLAVAMATVAAMGISAAIVLFKKGVRAVSKWIKSNREAIPESLTQDIELWESYISEKDQDKLTWEKVIEHIESISEDEQSDEMAYGQLERCIDYAKMLRERYDQGFTFDPWMHSKITKAEDYLNVVFDALDGGDGEIEESKISESLKNDVKKYIKKNQEDLDNMADADQWEEIYNQLYTDFDVEPGSDDAQELKTVFTVTY